MASHPRRVHGFPSAGISHASPQIRRAFQAITNADNYCPECFQFRGRDARRLQLHVRDEKIQEAVAPQGSLCFEDGQLVLRLNVQTSLATQQEAATSPLRQTATGLELKVLPARSNFADSDTGAASVAALAADINTKIVAPLNAILEEFRRAGYRRRATNG